MIRNLEGRITKLEQTRGPRRTYVVRVSVRRTSAEIEMIAEAAREGRRIALVPHKVATMEEWYTRFAPTVISPC
jgi:hypothetical protein